MQWQDEDLVSIQALPNGRYRVLELPPRQTDIFPSRKTFAGYEQAEHYIDHQYPHALAVQCEDIQQEQHNRKATC